MINIETFFRIYFLAGRKTCILIFMAIVCSCVSIFCQAQDMISDILTNNEIRVGITLNCPPFAFTDEEGKISGFNVDIANELADMLNVKLKIVEISPEELLESPDCDILLSNLPRTLELQSLFRFSEPYFQSGQSIIVSEKNLSINEYEELDTYGKRIVVVDGTAGKQVANKKFKKASIEIVRNEDEALSMLLRERADAFVYDRYLAEYICLSHPEWKVLSGQLSHDFYCILFPRKSEGSTGTQDLKSEEWYCLPWFNAFILELKLSKRYVEIFNRWFGPDKALR